VSIVFDCVLLLEEKAEDDDEYEVEELLRRGEFEL
jgi:hypothetical protein